MALLQISEPGLSTPPHQHRLAVGIDLGTTNSLVATVQSGSCIPISDEQGRTLLPSVVSFVDNEPPEVGYAAKQQQNINPQNTIASAKRLMGRGIEDVSDITHLPYRFVNRLGMLQIKTSSGIKSPVEISAEILKKLKTRAEKFLGGELVGAVITVPAYFDDAQRQATKDAAKLAGINVLRLLNEPTAAALAYGLDNGSEGIYVVYDLGGGTFDVSILRLSSGVFEVLSTNGNSALGGDDFDHRVYCWILEKANIGALVPKDKSLLLTKAREVKEWLSDHDEVSIKFELSDSTMIDLQLDKQTFDNITESMVAKTMAPVKKAMRDAKVKINDIQGVIMVGGATRMPQIRRAVGEFFNREPLTNLDPDKVVALGAATQANILAGNRNEDDFLLLDVVPLSLGLETMGGLVERIIPRNATIPVAREQDFTTYRDGQTAMSIHVVQGERELVADCRSLARFELRGIPPMASGVARIRVKFQVDADGLLSVTATEKTNNVESQVTVRPSYGLTEREMSNMLQAAFSHAEEDKQLRAMREVQVDAERLLTAVADALEKDGKSLLTSAERQHIDVRINALREAVAGQDQALIEQEIKLLNQATEAFAGRRMDASVQKALTGQKLDRLKISDH